MPARPALRRVLRNCEPWYAIVLGANRREMSDSAAHTLSPERTSREIPMSARKPAVSKTLIDDDRVITTEWRFAPGTETGWHRHGHDYVVVPMTTGTLTIEGPGGAVTKAALTAGVPYARKEGVEHNVANDSDREIVFVEIELK